MLMFSLNERSYVVTWWLGELRWSRPVPTFTKDVAGGKGGSSSPFGCQKDKRIRALKFGSSCFQVNPYTKKFEGSEDCLYLNVWTPRLDESVSCSVSHSLPSAHKFSLSFLHPLSIHSFISWWSDSAIISFYPWSPVTSATLFLSSFRTFASFSLILSFFSAPQIIDWNGSLSLFSILYPFTASIPFISESSRWWWATSWFHFNLKHQKELITKHQTHLSHHNISLSQTHQGKREKCLV